MEKYGTGIQNARRETLFAMAFSVVLAATLLVSVVSVPLRAQSATGQATSGQSPASAAPAAQSPVTQSLEAMEAAGIKMAFDVASVKPNKSGGSEYSNVPLPPGDVSPPNGGLFSATHNQVLAYITFAYNLTIDQLLHLQPQLPKLAITDRFDIEARAQGNPTRDQMRLMMQSLLADRFKLAVHTEIKQGPVYALVLSKAGKTGPQLQAHSDNGPCSTAPQVPGRSLATPSAPSSTSGLQLPPTLPCGGIIGLPASAPGRGRLVGRRVTIGLIAIYLTNPITRVDRPVLDRTGLSGNFDFSIEFTPEFNGPPPPNFQPDSTGPTFLEALQEQLGLKLEPQTGPVSVFVVDHLEEPSPN